MLIRSQDKRSLVDMTGITIKISFDGSGSSSEIRAFSNQTESQTKSQTGIYLGTYSTEEKAMKVLDMIQNEKYYNTYGGIFTMPADEDVEETV